MISPTLFFFKLVLAILAPLPVHTDFRKSCLYIQKVLRDFDGSCVEPIYKIWRIDIFAVLSLLMPEHRVSLHITQTFLIYFISVLQFQHTTPVPFCLIYTEVFHLFCMIVNGVVFLILVFMCLLLGHRNTIDYHMVILYEWPDA